MKREQILLLLKDKQKEISFEEERHIYLHKGQEYKSVTTLIHEFTYPFDPEGKIAEAVAKKNNMTVDEVKQEWDFIKNTAADTGTKIHRMMEEILDGAISKKQAYWYAYNKEGYKPVFGGLRFIEKYKTEKDGYFKNVVGFLATEVIVYSEEYQIAGQIDFLMIDKYNNLWIGDWKTNKNIDDDYDFQNRMKPPISNLYDTKYNRYSLQLSIYKKLLLNWGLQVDKIFLVHLPRDKSEFHLYPCVYREKEVNKILEVRKHQLEKEVVK